jgi:hypothetical protein
MCALGRNHDPTPLPHPIPQPTDEQVSWGSKRNKSRGGQEGCGPLDKGYWPAGKLAEVALRSDTEIQALPPQWTAREEKNSVLKKRLIPTSAELHSLVLDEISIPT